MSKVYIKISADTAYGDARITKHSTQWLDKCIADEPLLAADIIKDAVVELEQYYDRAVRGIFPAVYKRHEA